MEKNFELVAIKFCYKTGFMAAKMWEMFVKAFGDSSVLRATIFRLLSWFVVGEESIKDAERSRRPRTKKTSLGWQLF